MHVNNSDCMYYMIEKLKKEEMQSTKKLQG